MLTLHSQTLASTPGPCLLVHGGAWDIPDEVLGDHRAGLRAAIDEGRTLLKQGRAALDVVTEVVAVLEGYGAFDAGCGAMLNQEGRVELDAGVMDGATMEYGSVMAVRRLSEPVRVARCLLHRGEGQVRMLAGDGAERFAEAEGFTLVDPGTLISEREQARYEHLRAEAEAYHTSHSFLPGALPAPRGTVGCVARDAKGHLAAATSTGGTPYKPPGRVGDTPLPGAGFYANEHAAASATGWGEAIAAMLVTGRAVDGVAAGDAPEEMARRILTGMHERIKNPQGEGGRCGVILLSRTGEGAWAYSTPRMARGGWQAGGTPWVEV